MKAENYSTLSNRVIKITDLPCASKYDPSEITIIVQYKSPPYDIGTTYHAAMFDKVIIPAIIKGLNCE